MGGFISRNCFGRNDSYAQELDNARSRVQVRERSCAWKYACNKGSCAGRNGVNSTLYPMFDEETGELKKDAVPVTFLQRTGLPLVWLPMIIIIGVSIGLSVLQFQVGFFPEPLDQTPYSLLAVGVIGIYLLARMQWVQNKVTGAAVGFFSFWNANSSNAEYTVGSIPMDMLRTIDDVTLSLFRYDPACCEVWVESVSARTVLCELTEIHVANPYAVINANRATSLEPSLLPMSLVLQKELAYRTSRTNPAFLTTLTEMIMDRVNALEAAGFYPRDPIYDAIRGQIDSLNNAYGAIDITKINATKHLNWYLSWWLYIYAFFIPLILSSFGQIAALVVGNLISLLYFSWLALSKAQAGVFENLETNPYSTIPLQDHMHEAAVEAANIFNVFWAKVAAVQKGPRASIQARARARTTTAANLSMNAYNSASGDEAVKNVVGAIGY